MKRPETLSGSTTRVALMDSRPPRRPDSSAGRPIALPPPPGRLAREADARAKVERLTALARGFKRPLILTHDNPDPDSLASALALAQLFKDVCGLEATVGFGGIVGRAENKALIKVLKLPVVPLHKLDLADFDLRCLVDTQPSMGNHSLPLDPFPQVVIDHHPPRDETARAAFADVGGGYGATCTVLVEYLRAAGLEPTVEVATALFYGIKADTRDLGRQTDDADVEAYLWLFPRADKQALAQVEHPPLPAEYFRLYQRALRSARVHGDAVVADLGEAYAPDLVPQVAEHLMSLEGMKWSLAYARYEGTLYFSMRVRDRRMNAGKLIREICEARGGSAGGHGSMAGARIPLPKRGGRKLIDELLQRFLVEFGADESKADLIGVPLLEYGLQGD